MDPTDLVQKYQNNNMTLDEIAKYYEVSASSVRRCIIRNFPEFKFRPVRPRTGTIRIKISEIEGEFDPDIVKEVLDLYHEKHLNPYQIHQELRYRLIDIHKIIDKDKWSRKSVKEKMFGSHVKHCIYCDEMLPPGHGRKTCNDECLEGWKKYRTVFAKQKELERKLKHIEDLKAQYDTFLN